MSTIEVSVDLSDITMLCPFRAGISFGCGHDHENKPDDFPCWGGDWGKRDNRIAAESVLNWLCETVARLDRQLNPPPPEPEKPARKPRKAKP